MKILHIASHAGVYRGGAVQLTRLALAQRARGHEVAVIANVLPRTRAAQRARNLATWRSLEDASIPVRGITYEGLLGRMRLGFAIRKGHFDIVHAHRDEALLAAAHVLRGQARPAFVAQRGTVTPPPEVARRVFQSPRVGAIVAVARAVKDALMASAISGDKIHVVYGSVDTAHFAPRAPDEEKRAALGIPPGAPVIGSLSAYRKAKGLESLVEALGQALPRHPAAHAVFMGKKIKRKLGPRIEALPGDVSARIHLLDHQPDVAAWLSIMSLTVVAATAREGLSGVLRESLAMGVPVISTDCAGNGEIVRDGETGLLIPPDDTTALATALDRALSRPDDMTAMARAGREWVLANCSPAAQATAIETIYEKVMKG